MVILLVVLAILSLTVAAVSFVLYGRARMQEKKKQEKLFFTIHSVSLFILLLLGIVYMFFMVETET